MSETFTISDGTLKILQNFRGISDSIVLNQGHEQRVMTKGGTVLAIAQLEEDWPQETGIFKLGSFLSMASQFKQPQITFEHDVMTVESENTRVYYRLADPSIIIVPPKKTFPTDNPGVTFTLPFQTLKSILKQCLVLELTSVMVEVNQGKVSFRGYDDKNPLSHSVKIVIPETDINVFDANLSLEYPFNLEHLNMLLDGNYVVSLATQWKYMHLTNQNSSLTYFMAAQLKSK